jgi:putative ABC transport system substrate-binding protein
MKRREFITLIGGAAATSWPLVAHGQQVERVRRIGVLMGTADDREGQARVTALKQGLQELGWTDGRNIQIETRSSIECRPSTSIGHPSRKAP